MELSKRRVAIRAAKNGHSIDGAVLERRYDASFVNLARLAGVCDEIFLRQQRSYQKRRRTEIFKIWL